jgi:hypothetical protein
VIAVAVLAVVGLLGAACGGDDEPTADDATTTTTQPAATTTTTAAPTTTAEAGAGDPSTSVPEGEGISELEALASDLLILPTELGAPAEDQGYVPGAPCGVELDDEHPPDVQVGTRLLTPNGEFVEEIRIYPDTDAAIAAYETAVELERGCWIETRGLPTGPEDVNERVGADAAVFVTAGDRGGNLHRVTTRVADAVVTFSLSGQVGFVLDLVEVGAFGVGKIIAALEA